MSKFSSFAVTVLLCRHEIAFYIKSQVNPVCTEALNCVRVDKFNNETLLIALNILFNLGTNNL